MVLYDSAENLNSRLGATSVASSGALLHSPDGNNTFSPSSCNMSSPVMNDQLAPAGATDAGDGVAGAGASKKSTTRRNAWGNLSYADLITQAIMQSPEKRLTLSQGDLIFDLFGDEEVSRHENNACMKPCLCTNGWFKMYHTSGTKVIRTVQLVGRVP
ncbi:hypothetical protein ANCDUO_06668 [Ancylostoma duodenale]|uniref:Uncharacterized protein n=1 Tax=Ancylostoma duodenale TaxID=51022 RepID=A0A0C2H0Z4_9BILA|nr:hypothetical protein ANCDUO_06668 [Ancylostoma duodenale]